MNGKHILIERFDGSKFYNNLKTHSIITVGTASFYASIVVTMEKVVMAKFLKN